MSKIYSAPSNYRLPTQAYNRGDSKSYLFEELK